MSRRFACTRKLLNIRWSIHGVFALCLLSACNSRADREGEGGSAAEAGAELAAPAVETGAQKAARIRAQIEGALTPILIEPATARYFNARSGTGGAACGEVDSKQVDGSFSGPRPFVVTPQGVAVVSTGPRVIFEDPADDFADFYIRWCATPQELLGIGPRIASAPPPDIGVAEAPPVELPPPAPTEVAAAEPAKPPPSAYSRYPVGRPGGAPAAQAGTKASPPNTDDEDSFFNAVIRKRDESGSTK